MGHGMAAPATIHFHSPTFIHAFHPMVGRVCYCTVHYVIVDQWNRSLLNLLKVPSRAEVVRTLSHIVGRWQLSGSVYVFLIVTSYTLTLNWLTVRLRKRPAAFPSFARYNYIFIWLKSVAWCLFGTILKLRRSALWIWRRQWLTFNMHACAHGVHKKGNPSF